MPVNEMAIYTMFVHSFACIKTPCLYHDPARTVLQGIALFEKPLPDAMNLLLK